MPHGTDKIPKPATGKEITPEMITVIPTPQPKYQMQENYVRPAWIAGMINAENQYRKDLMR
jgi:hypothetical protein